MAIFYVSSIHGDDGNYDGTAPRYVAGNQGPWRSIAKALASGVGQPAPGDVVYIEPGTCRSGATAMGINGAAGLPITLVADRDGSGFAAAGVAQPVVGPVVWTIFTTDTTLSPPGDLLTMTSRNHVHLRGLVLMAGAGTAVRLTTCTNVSLTDCRLLNNGSTGTPLVATLRGQAGDNLAFDRCSILTMHSSRQAMVITAPLAAAEYNFNVSITNCMFSSPGQNVLLQTSGTGTALGYGLAIQNCTFSGSTSFGAVDVYRSSPIVMANRAATVHNCLLAGGLTINAGDAATRSHVLANGNVSFALVPYTNVTAGPNDMIGAAPLFNFGYEALVGLPPRPYLEPMAGSYLTGWGNHGTPPPVDFLGRPRPAAGPATAAAPLASVGALERHDTGTRDATYADGGTGSCLRLAGRASQDRLVLVNAQPTTISVKVRWDGNHGDAEKPQVQILSNPEIGLVGPGAPPDLSPVLQTLTPSSAGGTGSTPNAYETLTFAPIEPNAAGAVVVRFLSRAARGDGAAYFDTISLS